VVVPTFLARRSYDRAWLRPDLIAGLTVGAMLIPQSMSYAELAGMPPEYGFYAVIPALLVYAVAGTSRHLGVGPEPGTAVLAASGVAAVAGGDPARYVSLMATLAVLVGVICVIGAALRLGYLASMLSKPVLVGYITGVGLTLFSSQIAPFTGLSIQADSFFPRFAELMREFGDIKWTTTTLAAGSLTVILVMRRWWPTSPYALVGVVVASVVTAVGGLAERGVALVGAIPKGLPSLTIPDLVADDIVSLLPVAAGIALVGFTDNVLTARAIAAGRDYRIDPNREMLALGLTNLSAGVFRGFPLSSSASRTAVPALLGSRTQLVSVIAAVFVVVSLLAGRSLMSDIPRAGLAAVIVTAAIAIIEPSKFVSLWRVSKLECGLAALAALSVTVLGVLYGILTALGLSVVMALFNMSRPHDAVLGDLPGVDGWVDVIEYPEARTAEGLLVFRFDAPLFFINAERFRERLLHVLAECPGVQRMVVIDCEGIGAIDASGVDTVGDVLGELTRLGVSTVAVARANEDVLDRLTRGGLLAPDGPVGAYPTINAAVQAYHDLPEP
jgi:high affinity sulfate transporter 1